MCWSQSLWLFCALNLSPQLSYRSSILGVLLALLKAFIRFVAVAKKYDVPWCTRLRPSLNYIILGWLSILFILRLNSRVQLILSVRFPSWIRQSFQDFGQIPEVESSGADRKALRLSYYLLSHCRFCSILSFSGSIFFRIRLFLTFSYGSDLVQSS